jgi:arylsulfatase A-like enzyme
LAIGSHGLLGKQDLYEHSMKVPLILSGPGIPQHRTSDALVYLYDLFPTLAALCNLPPPAAVDGTSLVPVINGDTTEMRHSLFTAYRHTVRAVRDKTWKLIRYPERDFTQLFDLERDPLEIDNLAEREEYRDQVDKMMKLLNEWQVTADDTVRLTAETMLPMEYDPTRFRQRPDLWQPPYALKKYFKDVDVTHHSNE